VVKKLKKLPSQKTGKKKSKKTGRKPSVAEEKKRRVLGKVDAQAAQEFVDQFDYREFPEVPYYNFDEGAHKIRVLPPWRKGVKIPGISVYRHWKIPNPDDQSKVTSLVCLEKTYPNSGVSCPICDAISDIEDKAGIEVKRERASLKVYTNIVARSKRDEQNRKFVFDDEPTKVWVCPMPTSVFNRVMKYYRDPDVGDVTDIDEGYDLTVERVGSGFDTEYDVRIVPRPRPLFDSQDEIDECIEKMFDLDEVIVKPDDKEYLKKMKGSAALLKRKYMAPGDDDDDDEDEEIEYEEADENGQEEEEVDEGGDEDEDDDDDDEDEPTPKKKLKKAKKPPKKSSKKKRRPEPEEDDDEEAEEDDGGEEVEEEEEADEGDEDEPSEEEEGDEEVETPDEAIKALGLKPLNTPAVKEAVRVGGPKCYAQYPRVAKKYREVCANCAFEFPCSEDSGLEGPY